MLSRIWSVNCVRNEHEMEIAIAVYDLTKQYGKILAVDNISFTVNQGEVFGFLGPNGAARALKMVFIPFLSIGV